MTLQPELRHADRPCSGPLPGATTTAALGAATALAAARGLVIPARVTIGGARSLGATVTNDLVAIFVINGFGHDRFGLGLSTSHDKAKTTNR